jgi:hypothetical protein
MGIDGFVIPEKRSRQMRKFMVMLSLVALAAPVAAFADASPSPAQTANAMCAAAKTTMGASFATTYGAGKDALGKCVAAKSGTK